MRWALSIAAALLTLTAIVVMVEPFLMLSLLGPNGYWGQGQWGVVDRRFIPNEQAQGRALSIRITVSGLLALSALACAVKVMRSREESISSVATHAKS